MLATSVSLTQVESPGQDAFSVIVYLAARSLHALLPTAIISRDFNTLRSPSSFLPRVILRAVPTSAQSLSAADLFQENSNSKAKEPKEVTKLKKK